MTMDDVQDTVINWSYRFDDIMPGDAVPGDTGIFLVIAREQSTADTIKITWMHAGLKEFIETYEKSGQGIRELWKPCAP